MSHHPVLSSVLALLLLAASPAHAVQELLDGIAAQVGGEVVLLSEVEQVARPVESRMRQSNAPETEVLIMRAEVLDRLIDARLISAVVKRLELSATDDEIDNAIQGIAGDTGISVEQLARSVQSHGLSMVEYRAKIGDEIERSKVIATMVRSKVRVEEPEVRAAYDARFAEQPRGGTEVHVRHIVVGFGQEIMRDAGTACQIAAAGRARLEAGEVPFQRLAFEISDANAQRGGDLGWIHTRELAGWMAPQLSALEPGQVSDVIEMPFGCNLLQLVDRREFTPIQFDQARPTLEQEIYQRKTEEEYSKWIDSLREQTYIERKGIYAEASRLLHDTGGPGAGR